MCSAVGIVPSSHHLPQGSFCSNNAHPVECSHNDGIHSSKLKEALQSVGHLPRIITLLLAPQIITHVYRMQPKIPLLNSLLVAIISTVFSSYLCTKVGKKSHNSRTLKVMHMINCQGSQYVRFPMGSRRQFDSCHCVNYIPQTPHMHIQLENTRLLFAAYLELSKWINCIIELTRHVAIQ